MQNTCGDTAIAALVSGSNDVGTLAERLVWDYKGSWGISQSLFAGTIESGNPLYSNILTNTAFIKVKDGAYQWIVVVNSGVFDQLVFDNNVISIVKLKVRDSALRLDFEETGITSLETFDSYALGITNSGKIQVVWGTALVLDEGTYLELINSVVVLAGTCPWGVTDIGTSFRIFAAVASWCCVNDLAFSSLDAISEVCQDTLTAKQWGRIGRSSGS